MSGCGGETHKYTCLPQGPCRFPTDILLQSKLPSSNSSPHSSLLKAQSKCLLHGALQVSLAEFSLLLCSTLINTTRQTKVI